MIDMELKQAAAQERYAAAQCKSNDTITRRFKRQHEMKASALEQLIATRSQVRKAVLRAAGPFSVLNLQ